MTGRRGGLLDGMPATVRILLLGRRGTAVEGRERPGRLRWVVDPSLHAAGLPEHVLREPVVASIRRVVLDEQTT